MSQAPGHFDDCIVVDWSAAAQPSSGTDSCWVAYGALHGAGRVTSSNYATRQETSQAIEARLERSLAEGRRTLICVDVSFGFPAGAARILGLKGAPAWRALWSGIEERSVDDEKNRNNRFEVANEFNRVSRTRVFWGRPIAKNFEKYEWLPIKNVSVDGLQDSPLPRLRASEEFAGPGVISNWMLVGKGAVGGQVLTCLPYLERLRRTLDGQLSVWPFEGLGDVGTPVVLAETWFGLFDWKGEKGSCRDEQQVRGTLKAIKAGGREGILSFLEPASMTALSKKRQGEILAEEGWTFGVC